MLENREIHIIQQQKRMLVSHLFKYALLFCAAGEPFVDIKFAYQVEDAIKNGARPAIVRKTPYKRVMLM